MKRYCQNCKISYEFSPREVSGKEDLVCPSCGSIIPKNSFEPGGAGKSDAMESKIGSAVGSLFSFAYIYYLLLSVIGAGAFFLHWDTVLYVVTAIALISFVLQLLTGYLVFRSGVLFLPAGAVLGFALFKNIQGACFGIMAVFFFRHLLRDILYRLFYKLIGIGNSK